jgi:alkanesulfonate monooxygenase SsuD/methylene tetrahydromethanopterin reductase-like flavin-dependent oxidoreductase (luciferase family)
MPIAPFREYVHVVKELLDGNEVDFSRDGSSSLIRFQSPHLVAGERQRIPIHIGAIGPRAQGLAGEVGDGIITSFPRGGTISEVRERVAAGAAGRSLAGFEIYALMNLLLLEPGETLSSPRAVRQCGSAIMANVHYLVDLHRERGADPPPYVQPIWDDYLSFHATRDIERSHQLLHQSHYAYLDPDEERFITPEIIRNFCLAGQPREIIERLHELEEAGLHGVNFVLPADTAPAILETFATQVIDAYQE